MGHDSAVHNGAPGDRGGSDAGHTIKGGPGADDKPWSAGRRTSVGKYNFEGLSLPRGPLVREDESGRVHVRVTGQERRLPSGSQQGVFVVTGELSAEGVAKWLKP